MEHALENTFHWSVEIQPGHGHHGPCDVQQDGSMSAGCPCPREAAHLGTAALFEGGSKLADQKFSPGAAVRLLKQITSYGFQRRVGSPQQEGNINKRGAFSVKKGWRLSLTSQPPV